MLTTLLAFMVFGWYHDTDNSCICMHLTVLLNLCLDYNKTFENFSCTRKKYEEMLFNYQNICEKEESVNGFKCSEENLKIYRVFEAAEGWV